MPADCGDRVLAVGELTLTAFDFLHEGLAFSGVASVRFVLLETDSNVGVVPALTNSNNWPRLRIFQPHGLQTRSEYITGSCKNTNPTRLQTSANTTPGLSFLCDGLKRFSEDEYTCLPGIFPNFTLKEVLQILQLSLGRLSDITSLTYSLARFLFRTKLTNTRVSMFLSEVYLSLPVEIRSMFIGCLHISGKAVKRY